MKPCVIALLILFSACCCVDVNAANGDFGEDPQACLPLGEPCGIGVNGFRGAKCCPGSYCVSEVCKVFTPMVGGNPFAGNGKQPPSNPNVGVDNPNSKTPFDSPQEQQCKQKLKNAGCGHNAITALGPYCVCGCPNAVDTTEQEYKNIRDCPQFKKQITSSPECSALKDQFTEQCEACGNRCTLLIEKGFGN
ncbi:hypothetical protein MBANPS3_008748 [Mucor bainieri]